MPACTLGEITDLRAGRLADDASVLLVVTGSGLKDLAAAERSLDPAPLATVADVPELVSEWLAPSVPLSDGS